MAPPDVLDYLSNGAVGTFRKNEMLEDPGHRLGVLGRRGVN